MVKKLGAGRQQQASVVKLQAAAVSYDQKNYAGSAAHADAALRLDPSNWRAHKLRGSAAAVLKDWETAIKHFSAAFALHQEPDSLISLAECQRYGSHPSAGETLHRFIKEYPKDFRGYVQRAMLEEQEGRYAEAEASAEEARRCAPESVAVLNYLAHIKTLLGKQSEAEVLYRLGLTKVSGQASLLLLDNLATLLSGDATRLEEAAALYQQGLALEPKAFRSFNAGIMFDRLGRKEEALSYYQHALELDPTYAAAYNNIGFFYYSNGMMGDAELCFRKAVEFKSDRADFLTNLGAVLNAQGRMEEAEQYLLAAIDLRSGTAAPYHFLSTGYAARGLQQKSIEVLRAGLAVEPDYLDSLIQLAAHEENAGYTESALEHYRHAYQLSGRSVIRVLMAMLIPAVMGTWQDILACRQRVDQALDELLAMEELTISVEDLRLLVQPGFYFAFHGLSDREILTKFSSLLRKVCPELNWVNPELATLPPASGKLRIGFVSKYLFNHSVGLAYNPIIKALAERDDLEVSVVSLGYDQALDPAHVDLITAVDFYVPVPDVDLIQARNTIAQMRFDVIVYPDLGMYAFCNYLAHFRLAPVQCCFNGHPDTLGISTVDYRFSWDTPGEVPGAESHYSEKLVRLKYGGTFLPPPEDFTNLFSRESVGLGPRRAYVVPMKLQKLHPDFDEVMAKILAEDPEGEVVLFKDNLMPTWHELVLARLEKTIADPSVRERIRFSDWLPGPAFKSMLCHADILLDPFHFGAGTTGFIANSQGIPLVTMPMEFFRSRSVGGWYEALGVTDTVARSPEEYVRIAIDLARSPEKKKAIGVRVQNALADFKARCDGLVVDELANALIKLVHS
ncbi:hypothetical protein DLREEDagrD3_27250 [Denitratisoma sp. agr-D3]